MLLTILVLIGATQAAPTQPKELAIEGPFKEPLSGVAFPVASGLWVRSRVLQFSDAPHHNHAISYELRRDKELLATATGFVYLNESPVPDALDVHFDETLSELSQRGRGFELIKKLTLTLGFGDKGFESRIGMFIFRGGVGNSSLLRAEELFLIKHDTYWIKWRVTGFGTWPAERMNQVLELVQNLLPPN
jgi:hypothetical protein